MIFNQIRLNLGKFEDIERKSSQCLSSDKEILELLYMYFISGVYFVSLFTVPLVIVGYFENEFYAFQVSSLNTRPDFLL